MYKNYGLLIDGVWAQSASGETLDVISPATEQVIGQLPKANQAEVDAALESAQAAFKIWRHENPWVRSQKLRKAGDLLRERAQEIGLMMSHETGKPLAESVGEMNAAADQFEWYSGETMRIYGQTIEGRDQNTRMKVIYQPVGVVAAFSAWNFPALLPARKIAAALAAGCSIVIKPASEAPGSCLAIAQACLDAGVDKGVVNVLTGQSSFLSEALVKADITKKVSLTGSTNVGKLLLHMAADGIKKVSMELGGHAPVLVFGDVDGAEAAKTVAASKFRNCGQVCVSPTRFYVHESQYDAFTKAFADYANSLVLGNGADGEANIGPMVNKRGLESALSLIEDAVSKGARVLAGGKRPADKDTGFYLEPTVLADVPDDARIMSEEPFAPIAPITKFTDYDEVMERANGLPYGLAAYLFSDDLSTSTRAAEDLEAGMVGVNEVLLASAEMPFGGVKESGFGREGGSLGILEYLEAKFIKTKLK